MGTTNFILIKPRQSFSSKRNEFCITFLFTYFISCVSLAQDTFPIKFKLVEIDINGQQYPLPEAIGNQVGINLKYNEYYKVDNEGILTIQVPYNLYATDVVELKFHKETAYEFLKKDKYFEIRKGGNRKSEVYFVKKQNVIELRKLLNRIEQKLNWFEYESNLRSIQNALSIPDYALDFYDNHDIYKEKIRLIRNIKSNDWLYISWYKINNDFYKLANLGYTHAYYEAQFFSKHKSSLIQILDSIQKDIDLNIFKLIDQDIVHCEKFASFLKEPNNIKSKFFNHIDIYFSVFQKYLRYKTQLEIDTMKISVNGQYGYNLYSNIDVMPLSQGLAQFLIVRAGTGYRHKYLDVLRNTFLEKHYLKECFPHTYKFAIENKLYSSISSLAKEFKQCLNDDLNNFLSNLIYSSCILSHGSNAYLSSMENIDQINNENLIGDLYGSFNGNIQLGGNHRANTIFIILANTKQNETQKLQLVKNNNLNSLNSDGRQYFVSTLLNFDPELLKYFQMDNDSSDLISNTEISNRSIDYQEAFYKISKIQKSLNTNLPTIQLAINELIEAYHKTNQYDYNELTNKNNKAPTIRNQLKANIKLGKAFNELMIDTHVILHDEYHNNTPDSNFINNILNISLGLPTENNTVYNILLDINSNELKNLYLENRKKELDSIVNQFSTINILYNQFSTLNNSLRYDDLFLYMFALIEPYRNLTTKHYVNNHIGIPFFFGAKYNFYDSKSFANLNIPIGISITQRLLKSNLDVPYSEMIASRPRIRNSSSYLFLFFQLFDLGLPLSFNNFNSDASKKKFTFNSIVSPGINIGYNSKKTPFTMLLGLNSFVTQKNSIRLAYSISINYEISLIRISKDNISF